MTRRTLIFSAFTAANMPAFAQEPTALKLARSLNAITYPTLSPIATKHAKMILASTLASASAGRNLESVRIIRDLAKDKAGKREATLWFDGAKLPIAEAARVNAMASDAPASDDSDLRNVAHIGTNITAVGLAIAESTNASGQDLLAALVAGYEAAGRIGEAIVASSPISQTTGAISGAVGRGFHASSIVAFGGTATAAKLLHLTDAQLANALGTTATTVGGLSISTNSWAREYHAGNAALTAINAALAASRGFTVNPDMLEANGGFLSVWAGGITSASLERPLNNDRQISRFLAIKLFPGAHALHPAVEAAITASNHNNVSSTDVTKILVAGPQSALAASNRAPKDFAEAIHSLPYYLASAVLDGAFTWAHTDMQKLLRPESRRLMTLVDQDPNPPNVRYEWPWGATVTLVTKSGERYSATIDAPRGSAPRGIEWSDVDFKYRSLMTQSPRSKQVLDLIHNFETIKNTAPFAHLL